MPILITASGKEIPCTLAGVAASGFALLLAVHDISFMDAYTAFSKPEETKTLTYRGDVNGETVDRVFKGYVSFSGIDVQAEDGLLVTLTKKFEEVE